MIIYCNKNSSWIIFRPTIDASICPMPIAQKVAFYGYGYYRTLVFISAFHKLTEDTYAFTMYNALFCW